MDKRITAVTGGKIILENKVLLGKALLFDDKILDILDEEDFKKISTGSDMSIIDAGGKYVSPGFIDIHVHGSGGKDVMDGDLSGIRIMRGALGHSGVTGFFPTTLSMEMENIHKALDSVRLAMNEKFKGAKVLGAHLEGPFINPMWAGAHDKGHVLKPDLKLIENHMDVIKIITMAPEEDHQFRFIEGVLDRSDIVISMGHTSSSYDTAMEAIALGVRSATHLFNAMPPLHHRTPGVVGAVLNSSIYFELIADTIHVHPAVFQILLNAKGKDKMVLVSDSIRAGGMEDGSWELGGRMAMVQNSSARLEDGTLAGSVLTMNKAVFNLLKHTDLEIHEAVALASLNPAKLMNMDRSKGSIEIGKDADLTIFDEELEILWTLSGGEIIYHV